MEWNLFEHILSQIKEYAQVIQLYWMGEPFLHPKLFDMINACKQCTTAKVMLSTNGSLLSKDTVKKIVDSGLDEIIISLDAASDQKTYKAIKEGGDLPIVNSNVEYLLHHNKTTNIVLQFIDMFINRHEREAFVKKWSPYDCIINVQCLFSWANQIPSLNLASDNLSPVIKKPRIPCADLWNKMSIHWDGRVSICCFDWHTTVPLGNVTKEALIDIWQGRTIASLREAHLNNRFDTFDICKYCDAWAEPDEYKDLFHLN
jgi:radical SAM protein with 4Fe4S-binding SPASM domain